MVEIKLEYVEIDKKLSDVQNTSALLHTNAPQSIEGNELECIRKLEFVSKELYSLVTRYQNVLNQNIVSAKKSVDHMRQADNKLSTSIKSSSSNIVK